MASSLDKAEKTGILEIYLSGENAMVSPLHRLSKWVVATCMQLENLENEPKKESICSETSSSHHLTIARIQGCSISKRVLVSNQEEILPDDWMMKLQASGEFIQLEDSVNAMEHIQSCPTVEEFIELDRTEFERIRQAQIRRLWAWKRNLQEKQTDEELSEKIGWIEERISFFEAKSQPPPVEIDIVFEQSIQSQS